MNGSNMYPYTAKPTDPTISASRPTHRLSKFKVQSSKYFICHCHKNNETVEAATDS